MSRSLVAQLEKGGSAQHYIVRTLYEELKATIHRKHRRRRTGPRRHRGPRSSDHDGRLRRAQGDGVMAATQQAGAVVGDARGIIPAVQQRELPGLKVVSIGWASGPYARL
jgi:hypothetical protein